MCCSNEPLLTGTSSWTDEQREVGDRLYYELRAEHPKRAAKLTGMLLSMPSEQLKQLLSEKKKLKAKVNYLNRLLDVNKFD